MYRVECRITHFSNYQTHKNIVRPCVLIKLEYFLFQFCVTNSEYRSLVISSERETYTIACTDFDQFTFQHYLPQFYAICIATSFVYNSSVL